MLAQGVTQAELARRLGMKQQEVRRVLNLRHATEIDTIEAAFHALGKRLEMTIP
ncbi:Antitoxin HicB [compost metagenome]